MATLQLQGPQMESDLCALAAASTRLPYLSLVTVYQAIMTTSATLRMRMNIPHQSRSKWAYITEEMLTYCKYRMGSMGLERVQAVVQTTELASINLPPTAFSAIVMSYFHR